MKYTNYIINGKFMNMGWLQSRNIWLNGVLRIISIVVALFGVGMVSGFLPMTIMVDGYRNLKTRFIYFRRRGYRL